MSSEEQRRHPRLPVDTKIVIHTPKDVAHGKVRDISSSGMFANCEELLPVDSLCEFELIINTDAQELRIRGQSQVVRLERNAKPETRDWASEFSIAAEGACAVA